MKRFLIGFLATIGALALLLVVVSAGAGFWLFRSFADAPLPERMVLTVDLDEPLEEAVDLEPFAALSLEQPLEVSELVLALERAALDPRVAGLVARLDATDHGFAVAEEVRAAIQAFAASGRPTVAWADSFGELGAGNEGYFIATAFDKISLQPGGQVGLTGLIAEVPFVKPLLDRLGIQAEVVRRSDYKTALDSVTETGLTEANATMLNQLLDGIYGTWSQPSPRPASCAGEVEQLIDEGPFEAEAALEAGLIDGLAYRDEVIDAALEAAGEDAELVPLAAYARRDESELDEPEAVAALIVAQGMIQRGTARFERMIGADDLAELLAEAREDDAIDAVVLRLDTGGGSAVASETVGREVALLRDSGKPIIVSMGNAAASGGYWIAMGANHIVAQPATYTGSIGVIAGKPDLAGAWEQLGVNWASIAARPECRSPFGQPPVGSRGPATPGRERRASLRAVQGGRRCRARHATGRRRGGSPGPRLARRPGAAARPGRRAGWPARGPCGRRPSAAAARGCADRAATLPAEALTVRAVARPRR